VSFPSPPPKNPQLLITAHRQSSSSSLTRKEQRSKKAIMAGATTYFYQDARAKLVVRTKSDHDDVDAEREPNVCHISIQHQYTEYGSFAGVTVYDVSEKNDVVAAAGYGGDGKKSKGRKKEKETGCGVFRKLRAFLKRKVCSSGCEGVDEEEKGLLAGEDDAAGSSGEEERRGGCDVFRFFKKAEGVRGLRKAVSDFFYCLLL